MSVQQDVRGRIIVALDLESRQSRSLLRKLVGGPAMVKVGIEAINGGWAIPLARLARDLGFEVMWDAKLHDIPSRVAATIETVVRTVDPLIITVHALGSLAMMRRAKYTAAKLHSETGRKCQIFGVTLPTSTDPNDFKALGFNDDFMPSGIGPNGRIAYKAADLGRLGDDAHLNGVVGPASALPIIRHAFPKLKTIVPAVRPYWAVVGYDDQSQSVTPREAFETETDYIVVGRPVTEAKKAGLTPLGAFERIVRESEAVQGGSHGLK